MQKHSATVAALTALLLGVSWASAQEAGDKGGSPRKVSLGIAFEVAGPKAPQKGIVVREVLPSSPAAKAGLRANDLITKIDDKAVDSYQAMKDILSSHKPGDTATFHLVRGGKERELKVTFGEPFSQEQPDKGKGPRPRAGAFLGVQAAAAQELPPPVRQRLGVKQTEGLVVLDVLPNSPAARAGLKRGDVILTLNGKRVENSEALRRMVREAGKDGELQLEVKRGDQKMELKARLGQAPEEETSALPGGAGAGVSTLRHRLDDLERRVRELERHEREAIR